MGKRLNKEFQMNELETKLIELAEKYETLKEEMKRLKPEMNELLKQIGVGKYFQNPKNMVVYKVEKPRGVFCEYQDIGFVRTKKAGEARGDLSVKEANEAGFVL
jgi:seryl-tRNA synthetase